MKLERSLITNILSFRLIRAFVDVVEPAIIWLFKPTRWIVVEAQDKQLLVYRVAGKKISFVGTIESLIERHENNLRLGRNIDLELRIPIGSVIQTTLKIPSEGLTFIDQFVESRLERLTPWRAEKIIYGFSPALDPSPDGQIEVQFAATSQEIVSASIDRLAAIGLVPSRLGPFSEPLEKPLRIDLLRGRNDAASLKRRRNIAIAAIASFTVFFISFSLSTYAVTESVDRLEQTHHTITRLRTELVGPARVTMDQRQNADILAAKSPERAMFLFVNRLATIIPDNTYLSALDITTETVRIGGVSAEAAALVPVLEKEQGFSQATFIAPVTRQADGSDRFDITIQRVQGQNKLAP